MKLQKALGKAPRERHSQDLPSFLVTRSFTFRTRFIAASHRRERSAPIPRPPQIAARRAPFFAPSLLREKRVRASSVAEISRARRRTKNREEKRRRTKKCYRVFTSRAFAMLFSDQSYSVFTTVKSPLSSSVFSGPAG